MNFLHNPFEGTREAFEALTRAGHVPAAADQFKCAYGSLTPDLSAWRAGDVFLCTPVRRRKHHEWIVMAQVAACGPGAHAEWTHVGIMAEDGRIWDVTPDHHVRAWRPADFILECSKVGVRRPGNWFVQRRALVDPLQDMANVRYPTLPAMLISGALAAARLRTELPVGVEYCSTYVETVINSCHDGASPFMGERVFPAHFAASERFHWMPARWLRV